MFPSQLRTREVRLMYFNLPPLVDQEEEDGESVMVGLDFLVRGTTYIRDAFDFEGALIEQYDLDALVDARAALKDPRRAALLESIAKLFWRDVDKVTSELPLPFRNLFDEIWIAIPNRTLGFLAAYYRAREIGSTETEQVLTIGATQDYCFIMERTGAFKFQPMSAQAQKALAGVAAQNPK